MSDDYPQTKMQGTDNTVFTLLGKSSYKCDGIISTLLRSVSHSLICIDDNWITFPLYCFCKVSDSCQKSGTLASYLICDILWDSRYLVGNTRVSILLEKWNYLKNKKTINLETRCKLDFECSSFYTRQEREQKAGGQKCYQNLQSAQEITIIKFGSVSGHKLQIKVS